MTEKSGSGTGGSIEAPAICGCAWGDDLAPERPCGCGHDTVRLYRDTVYHWRGQHWHSACLIQALAALLTRRDQPEQDEPYFVEVDSNGCERCNAGKTWTVVGPDGCAASQSWEQEEDAEAFADAMNVAYWMGKGTQRDAPQEQTERTEKA